MKPLHFFFLLFSLTLFSCSKTNDEAVNPNSTNDETSIMDYSTLIVGKWQLTEIGTKPCSATCFMKETAWVKTTNSEILDFKATGEFTKDLKTDELCKGIFQITTDGRLVTKSSCNVEENITHLTKTELVIDAPNRMTCYKYVRQ